jgi:hypothetical protein
VDQGFPPLLKSFIQSSIEAFVPREEDANVLEREDIFFVTDQHVPRYFEDR